MTLALRSFSITVIFSLVFLPCLLSPKDHALNLQFMLSAASVARVCPLATVSGLTIVLTVDSIVLVGIYCMVS